MALGEADPDELLARLPLRTFQEWRAYYALRPFGDHVAALRDAVMPYLFSLAFGGKGARPRFEDYVIGQMDTGRKSEREMAALLDHWARRHNAGTRRKRARS